RSWRASSLPSSGGPPGTARGRCSGSRTACGAATWTWWCRWSSPCAEKARSEIALSRVAAPQGRLDALGQAAGDKVGGRCDAEILRRRCFPPGRAEGAIGIHIHLSHATLAPGDDAVERRRGGTGEPRAADGERKSMGHVLGEEAVGEIGRQPARNRH